MVGWAARAGGLAARERTDEELAEEDAGGEWHLIVDREAWRSIAPIQVELLAAAEKGLGGAIAWLDARSIAHVVAPAGCDS